MADTSDRQKRIMEHLARSTGGFIKTSSNPEGRKQRIMEHIRLTRGWGSYCHLEFGIMNAEFRIPRPPILNYCGR